MQSCRAAHRHSPSHVPRAQVRWKEFSDHESQVVWCELRVIDLAEHAEVRHEANVPCDGTEQQIEMTGLNLQHTLARKLTSQSLATAVGASREPA